MNEGRTSADSAANDDQAGWKFMYKIGHLTFDVPVCQAALSGYSDRAMRRLAVEFGAPLTFTGVILAKTILHPQVLRKITFLPAPDEHPVAVQLVGEDVDVMVRAAKAFSALGYDFVDLNFACPVPKMLRRQRGGWLMREADTVIEMFRRVREAIAGPLTLKIRRGFDDSAESIERFWKIVETTAAEGVDGLIIHGRTVEQRYRGHAEWEILAEVKRRVPKTTIIGSGDIYTVETIEQRLKETGIDAIAIARGAVGNPWIFAQARAHFTGQPMPAEPDLAEQAEVMRRHLRYLGELYPERSVVNHFRKFAAWYVRRHGHRRLVLLPMMQAKSLAAVDAIIAEWYDSGAAAHANDGPMA